MTQMKRDSKYKDYIVEDVLGHIPGITAKAMFSGWGIYLGGLIVGIIADGELYFKADSQTVVRYKSLGYYPFSYERNGKMVEMAYMSVPAEVLEDRGAIKARVDESYQISVREDRKK